MTIRPTVIVAIVASAITAVFAQNAARDQLARGQALWDQRLANSAIAALEIAARNKTTAAEAHETLGSVIIQGESATLGDEHEQPEERYGRRLSL